MWCFANKNLHENCRMGRRIVVMKLTCSIGHCECDDHTVHKLIQGRLTADWLSPRESDCLRMHSKVSSDRLSSYLTATRPVLEIFKMAGYFLDSPHNIMIFWMWCYVQLSHKYCESWCSEFLTFVTTHFNATVSTFCIRFQWIWMRKRD